MAYDPKDPADVAIVAAAVDAERDRLEAEHQVEVDRLQGENAKARQRLRDARNGNGDDASAAEIARLEGDLATVQGELRTAQSNLRQATRDLDARTIERDTAARDLETERTFARDTLVNSSLTSALVEANVQPQFLEDVTASLSRGVTIKEVDGKRMAFVGDKPLGEHVKEWSQGDKGKHYVSAPANGGGGAGDPGKPQGGAKAIWQMNDAERVAAYNANPTDFQRRVDAGENVKPPEAAK